MFINLSFHTNRKIGLDCIHKNLIFLFNCLLVFYGSTCPPSFPPLPCRLLFLDSFPGPPPPADFIEKLASFFRFRMQFEVPPGPSFVETFAIVNFQKKIFCLTVLFDFDFL